MQPDPEYSVIGLYADGTMMPFVLSTGRLAMNILSSDVFDYPFKTALLTQGLLEIAVLQDLLAEGHDLLPEDDEDEEPDADECEPPADEDRPVWQLTLPEVLTIATAADLAASLYLTSLADEARTVQVEINDVPPEVYDAKIQATLGYLSRFQAEWAELFGEYAGYRARMEVLAELRAEYI